MNVHNQGPFSFLPSEASSSGDLHVEQTLSPSLQTSRVWLYSLKVPGLYTCPVYMMLPLLFPVCELLGCLSLFYLAFHSSSLGINGLLIKCFYSHALPAGTLKEDYLSFTSSLFCCLSLPCCPIALSLATQSPQSGLYSNGIPWG